MVFYLEVLATSATVVFPEIGAARKTARVEMVHNARKYQATVRGGQKMKIVNRY